MTTTTTTAKPKPEVFISYSHDSDEHRAWVRKLCDVLSRNDIHVISDIYDVAAGKDIAAFMRNGLSVAKRVVAVCSTTYVQRAKEGKKGVGFETTLILPEYLSNATSDYVIPILRNNPDKEVPDFLTVKAYVNFNDDPKFDDAILELLRALHNEPTHTRPESLGNPFDKARAAAKAPGTFVEVAGLYENRNMKGHVHFNYSNNGSNYVIGSDDHSFILNFSTAGNGSIHAYHHGANIASIALVDDVTEIDQINDASKYDTSNGSRTPNNGMILVYRNRKGNWAAVKITSVVASPGGIKDDVGFDYVIQSNGTPDFTTEALIA